MTLKEAIVLLEQTIIMSPNVQSTSYGTLESIDSSKKGIDYPLVHIYWVESDHTTSTLKFHVVDDVIPTLTNRLDVQSASLSTAKEVVSMIKALQLVESDVDVVFEPTRLQGTDQHEGVSFDISILTLEHMDTCDLISN